MTDEQTTESMPPSDGSSVPPEPASFQLNPGDRVGNYVIREQIGEGGFAIVYAAEQEKPVRRKVALKIIKLGMDTKQVIARFEAERQALAMMDHPNVAKVFDAGATETGRPYFIMEYVAGTPITDYCDRQRLSIEERLQLFIQVCEAVQHAHQKAIIHRDIKPSNVLVATKEGQPQAKVIDFGVAKAITHRLTEQTIYTEQGQLIGTPEYMSPEQAEMTAEDIDTRTDLYSLGVVLYELLTGALPFDSTTLRQAGFGEIQRIIREDEPPKPSTRLSSLGDDSAENAQQRRLDPKALYRELYGDLDWIVMKALEKDRNRRYETANGLAMDLRRHLDNEPVLASPPSAAYKLSKFVRRNRAGVAAGTVVALSLLVAVVISVRFALSEAEQREILEQVAEFQESQFSEIDVPLMATRLRADVLAEARNAWNASKIDASEIEERAERLERLLAGTNFTDVAIHTLDKNVFEAALVAVDEKLGDQPLVRAHLLQTLATQLRLLALWERAKRPQIEALAIRRRVLGDEHPDTLDSIMNRGFLFGDQGKIDEAEPYYREALEGRRRVLGDEHPSTLISMTWLGYLLQDQGKIDEAEPYYWEALKGLRSVLGDEHPYTLISIRSIGRLLQTQGKIDEAEPYYREALEGLRSVLGDEHPRTLTSISDIGYLLQRQDKFDEAEPYILDALEGRRRVLGDDHPQTIDSISRMGYLLQRQDRLAEAELYFLEALEIRRRVLGDEHPDTLESISRMGYLRHAQDRLDEAALYYQEAIVARRRVFGDEHPHTLDLINRMANLRRSQDRFDEAALYYQEVVAARRRVLGDEHPDTLASCNYLARLLNYQQRFTESEPILRASVDTGTDHWRVAEARSLLGESVAGQKRFNEAEPLLLEGYTGLESSLTGSRRSQGLPPAIERLIKLYDAWGKPDQAAEWRAKLPTEQDPVASDPPADEKQEE